MRIAIVTLTAIVLLILTRVSLRVRGFAKTIESFRSQTDRRVPLLRGLEPERVSLIVAIVAAGVPARMRCLEQSLVTHTLLRWAGMDSHMRLGVQAHPFCAHAWVEVNGRRLSSADEQHAATQTFDFSL